MSNDESKLSKSEAYIRVSCRVSDVDKDNAWRQPDDERHYIVFLECPQCDDYKPNGIYAYGYKALMNGLDAFKEKAQGHQECGHRAEVFYMRVFDADGARELLGLTEDDDDFGW